MSRFSRKPALREKRYAEVFSHNEGGTATVIALHTIV